MHPKDPFKRVDCVQSSTPIRISIPVNGKDVLLAESVTSVHLCETMLPTRYYLPYASLKTIYLRDSDTISECPYKGIAQYHDVIVGTESFKDLIWWYRCPTADCIQVTGLRCFYNEKVDISFLQLGEWRKMERPETHFA